MKSRSFCPVIPLVVVHILTGGVVCSTCLMGKERLGWKMGRRKDKEGLSRESGVTGGGKDLYNRRVGGTKEKKFQYAEGWRARGREVARGQGRKGSGLPTAAGPSAQLPSVATGWLGLASLKDVGIFLCGGISGFISKKLKRRKTSIEMKN